MTKRIISILIASLMLLTIIPLSTVTAASKYSLCDVNNDGKITAADARKALRYSVELETPDEQQFFSADCAEPKGKISAVDARLILRVSVELEAAPVHTTCNYTTVKIVNAPTCTSEGEREFFCACGNSIIEPMAVLGHRNTSVLPGKAATCSSTGLTDGLKCNSCETILKVQQATKKADHSYDETITATASGAALGSKKLTCTVCGYSFTTKYSATHEGHTLSSKTITAEAGITCITCQTELIPSFNTLVNDIKSSNTLRFKTFRKSQEKSSKADIKAGSWVYEGMALAFSSMLEKEVPATDTTEYTALSPQFRPVTSKNYPLIGSDIVSALKDTDINNITTSVVDLKTDFLNSLPNSYTAVNGEVVNLTSIKNTAVGDVIKVRVEVLPENSTIANPPSDTSPASRIAYANLSNEIKKFSNELNFSNLSGDNSALSQFMSSDMLATSTCTVDYYFTMNTHKVVAAKYNSSADMTTLLNLFFDDDGNRQEKPTLTITIDADFSQENYFFFNSAF